MPTFHRNAVYLITQNITKFDALFNGTLCTWKTDPVCSEIKEGAKPICSRPYPVPKIHK